MIKEKERGATDYQELNEEGVAGDINDWKTLSFNEKTDFIMNSIHRLAGNGKFQKSQLFSLIFVCFTSAFAFGLIGYSTPTPTAVCQQTEDGQTFNRPCTEIEACSLISRGLQAQIIFTYENWTQEYGLYCEKSHLKSSGQTLFIFLLGSIACLELYLGDTFGRKFLATATSFMALGGGLGTLLVPGFLWKCVFLAMAASSVGTIGALTIFSGTEYCDQSFTLSKYYMYIVYTSYPVGAICLALLTFYSKNSTFLVFLTSILVISSAITLFLFFPESPVYLLYRHDVDPLMDALFHIRQVNGRNPHIHLEVKTRWMVQSWIREREERIKSDPKINPLVELFRNKTLALNLVGMLMLSITANVLLNAPSLFVSDLGSDNPSINGLITSSITLISNLAILPFAETFNKKAAVITLQSVFIASACLLILLNSLQRGASKLKMITTIFINAVFIPAANNALFVFVYVINPDLFPPKLRATAFSVIGLAGIISMVTPWLATLALRNGLNFMVGCCLPCLISLPLTIMFKKYA